MKPIIKCVTEKLLWEAQLAMLVTTSLKEGYDSVMAQFFLSNVQEDPPNNSYLESYNK